ncbi:MAG: DMT family transporter [Betaproteobacteria bacterium]|nr:DMT family transporter [Betaproteobacteria bacterium]
MSPANLARLIALGALWGASFLFIRMAVPSIGAAWFAELRVVLAALAMLAYAKAIGLDLRMRSRWKDYAFAGALNTGLPWGLFAFAGQYLSASHMAILNAITPLFAAICGAIWLRESFTLRLAAGLALGIAGVAVLSGFDTTASNPDMLLGVFACLAACLAYALGSIFVKRRLADTPPLTMGVACLVFATLVTTPMLTMPPPASAFSAGVIVAVLGISLLCSALGYLIYFRLLAEVGPTRALTVTFLIPVFGVLWGVTLLGETLSAATLLGGGMVLIATALVLYQGASRKIPA